MNFIDYLIETKNYSALSAVNEYTKSFGKTNPEITDPKLRSELAKNLKRDYVLGRNLRKILGKKVGNEKMDKMADTHRNTYKMLNNLNKPQLESTEKYRDGLSELQQKVLNGYNSLLK